MASTAPTSCEAVSFSLHLGILFPVPFSTLLLISLFLKCVHERGVGRYLLLGKHVQDGRHGIYIWTGLVPMARSHTRPCLHNNSLTRDALTSMAAALRLAWEFSYYDRVMDMVSSDSKMLTSTTIFIFILVASDL